MRTTTSEIAEQCKSARLRILEMAYSAHKGHIGSGLSVVELVAVGLSVTRGLGAGSESRDRFVLSKGHSANALFALLNVMGHLRDSDLATYGHDDSYIATHPTPEIDGVDFATGSLGQGITYATGAALAARLRGDDGRVYCVLSDSELDEGSTWEAALIASQLGLSNLTVVLDFNRQQALGRTRDVINVDGVPDAWAALGWNVARCAGHDVAALVAAVEDAHSIDAPSLIVADTIAGNGVDFMEGKVEWHYLPMTDGQYTSAREQVAARELV